MSPLVVSNLLLWVAVVLLAGLVLALLRQIGVLHQRIAPVGALATGHGPPVGARAPEVSARDWRGALHRVGAPSDAGRSTLLVFVSPTCPVCETLLPAVEALAREERGWLDVRLASDGPRTEHEAFVERHDLARFGYLLGAELGLAYRVGRLPHAVLVDAGGRLRAQGLVNSREHLESLVVAMEDGVASVQEYLGSRGAAAAAGGRDEPARSGAAPLRAGEGMR